ncbi:MAG: glycine/sarcosine/betaine reductase component B subunit [Oscillospiraceae bacterium]|nr:glycine/sarcosine/betaine reductase component B subunit [Oscillospiraceae bacterium]
MKLTLEYVDIKDIQFSDRTCVKNGTLFINKAELTEQILTDPKIKSVDIDIVKPGESVRVLNVADCIEPRAKMTCEADWAGVIAGFDDTLGTGTTRALKGMSIMICDPNCIWSGLIGNLDMSGPGADWSPYSKLVNLCIACYPNGKQDPREYAHSIRKACYGAGVYLAKSSDKADRTEILDNETRTEGLPNIGYYYQIYSTQHDYENIPESIYYGFAVPDTLPLVIQPQEVIDGAIAWGCGFHMMETYAIQNHPIILDLMRRHGKDLNFVGMMVGVVSMDGKRRHLAGMMIGNTMKEVFHADGVVMTKTMGGAPHVCEGVAASECEKRGIKTVTTVQILNLASNLSTEVLFNDPKLNAIVQFGAYFDPVAMPAVERVFGGDGDAPLPCAAGLGGPTSKGDIINATTNIMGCVSHVGNFNIIAVDY